MNGISAWLATLTMPAEERRVRLAFLQRRAAVLKTMRNSTWGNGSRHCPICGLAEWVDVVPFALAHNNTIFIATKPAA